MDRPARIYLHLALICAFVQPGICSCNTLGKGHCRTSKTNTTWDMTAMDVDGLCCQFHNTLCQYSQGCRDPDMANWTAGSGFVDVHHVLHGPCTEKSFSVLESPWIRFPTTSCVQFSFGRHASYALQVYLAWSHSSPAQRLLAAYQNSKHNGNVQTERNTITSSDGVGKLLFRARGGGGDIDLYVRLYNVTVQTGPCDSNNTEVCSRVNSGAGTGTDNGTNNGTGTGADNGANNGDSSGSNTGAIVGAVVTVVIVVVVVVVVAVVVVSKRRKKSRGRPSGHNNIKMSSEQQNGKSDAGGRSVSVSSPTLYSTTIDPSILPNENNYTQIDDVRRLPDVITPQTGDIGNYCLAKNISAERSFLTQNDYRHVSNMQQSNELNPNEEDAYSVFRNSDLNPHPVQPGRHASEDYNELVHGSRKPLDAKPEYANADDYDRIGTVSALDCGHKTAASTEIIPDDYNRIGTVFSLDYDHKTAASTEIIPDDYNRIGTVSSLDYGHRTAASSKLDPDDYNRIGIVAPFDYGHTTAASSEPVSGDYYILSTDTPREMSFQEKGVRSGQAYDRVKNVEDDDYNTTQTKKTIVVGSDYDHIRP